MTHDPPLPLQLTPEITVVPWVDELVEKWGFEPRSLYVESCWLPLLGPTATWLYRRLGTIVIAEPEGVSVDLIDLSVSLGLGEGLGRSSLIARALGRLARFNAADWQGQELAVRRALGPVSERFASKLSYSASLVHQDFVHRRSA